VSSSRQAPEATEIRAQEEVRTQDDEAKRDRGPGDEPIREALETAAEDAEMTGGLGTPGRPINRRSPFMVGLTGAFGVAVAYDMHTLQDRNSQLGRLNVKYHIQQRLTSLVTSRPARQES